MKPQVYLPAYCSPCGRASLVRAPSDDRPTCRDCGGSASVMPGETYAEEDVALFEKVAAAVDEQRPAPPIARKIAAELRDARIRSQPPEAVLLRIVDDIPGLRFLIPALYLKHTTPAHRVHMQRAMGMVLTLANHFCSDVGKRDGTAARGGDERPC